MSDVRDTFQCLLVSKGPDGAITRRVTTCSRTDLPPGDVLVRVRYSSLNYKDALAATGHPGVVSRFPHVPGIDAAGIVVEGASPDVRAGDEIIVTSFDLGAGQWGAWAEYIRVPAEWVIALPAGMSVRDAMTLGTAGFTAALAVEAIQSHEIAPDAGDVVVTGASGGVGTLAVAILAKLGYRVVAVSGKTQAHDLLQRLGAAEVLPREAVVDASKRPLLAARWAAAVDTVGGSTLADILRSAKPHGCVTACGLVGGIEVPTTVYPFILRGVTLAGIDSAWYPAARRAAIWQKLAGPWKPRQLDELVTEVGLDSLEEKIQAILAGQITGRIVVSPV